MIPASINAPPPGNPVRPAAGLSKPAAAKRGRRAAGSTPGSTTVPVPLSPDLIGALQTWIASRPEPRPDLPEALRFALREWLMARQLRDHLGQPGA